MSPSSDPPQRGRKPLAAAGALVLVQLVTPVIASALPPGETAPVVPVRTATVAFAGGTAELDGSTTLEDTNTGTRSRIDCTILFAKDSDRLRPGAKEKLQRLGRQLRGRGPGKLVVTGYTDDLGSAAHGLDLSRRRAHRVATELRRTLATVDFPITARGLGEADPAVPNTNETNRRKNRRVLVTLTPTRKTTTTTTSSTPPAVKPKPTPTPSPSPTASATAVATSTAAASPVPSHTTGQRKATTPPPPHPSQQPWPGAVLASLGLVAAGALVDIKRRRHSKLGTQTATGTPRPSDGLPTPGEPVSSGSEAAPEVAGGSHVTRADLAYPTGAHAVVDSTGPADAGHADDAQMRNVPQLTPEVKPGDGRLDEDIAAWFSLGTHRPRLALLGPVHARTRGQALARRKPYYTELLAYLTLKPHGATADQIADTFGLTTARVRTDMKILRDWLGNDPTTGTPYLPDARTSPAALWSGLPTYQVRNVLCDWLLLIQLHQRISRTTNKARTADIATALRLVSGRPFSHTRTNGWGWIFEDDRLDVQATETISAIETAASQDGQGNEDQILHGGASASVNSAGDH